MSTPWSSRERAMWRLSPDQALTSRGSMSVTYPAVIGRAASDGQALRSAAPAGCRAEASPDIVARPVGTQGPGGGDKETLWHCGFPSLATTVHRCAAL